jgi:hypothetical protein
MANLDGIGLEGIDERALAYSRLTHDQYHAVVASHVVYCWAVKWKLIECPALKNTK